MMQDRGSLPAGEGKVRLRFAPSPTGLLHIGNARTALYNWLFARHTGGIFILRIEDTDVKRSAPEFVETILNSLHWLGLDWDEGPDVGGPCGPYFQSQRKPLYQEHVERLLKEGKAYFCYCEPGQAPKPGIPHPCRDYTQKEIKTLKAQGLKLVIRFKTPMGEQIRFHDLLRGDVDFLSEEVGDFSIMKEDGSPLYNFSVVVDDHAMGITHVFRGEDHLSNTPKQLLLYRAFGYEPPEFLHLPLIHGEDGTPLSKRHGATSVEAYRTMGYLPSALFNFLALLGWSPGSEREFFSREELIQAFQLDRLHHSPARFSLKKLNWMNGKYIREMPRQEFESALCKVLQKGGLLQSPAQESLIPRIAPLFVERIETFGEIVEKADFFFQEVKIPPTLQKKYLSNPHIPDIFQQVLEVLSLIEPFIREKIEPALRQLVSDSGLKTQEVFQPLRVAITGKDASPPLFDCMEILGKEKVLRRIRTAIP